jgi:hypothetical protein
VGKEEGIHLLLILFPFINPAPENSLELKETYLKLFPVFFSWAEVFLDMKSKMKALTLTTLIMRHPLFSKEKRYDLVIYVVNY